MSQFVNFFRKYFFEIVVCVVIFCVVFFAGIFFVISTHSMGSEIVEIPGFEDSIVVVNAKYEDGEVLMEENTDVLIHPGSNYKMLTAAACLHYLGTDYVFKTRFYVFDVNGKNSLLIKGSGDPTFGIEHIQEIGKALLEREIFIDGDLYYDDSFFVGEKYGPDWEEDWKEVHFAVPVSALQMQDSLLYLIGDGGPHSDYSVLDTIPLRDYEKIVDNTSFVEGVGEGVTAVMSEDGVVTLEGEISDYGLFVAPVVVPNPAWLTTEVFKQEFFTLGLVSSDAEVLEFESSLVDGDLEDKLVYEYKSVQLEEIVRRMLTFSKNNYGETLVRILGEEVYDGVDTVDDIADVLGDSQAKGVKVLEKFLFDVVGIEDGDFVGLDGSGMSPSARITGRGIMQLFDFVNEASWSDVFWEALPVSGDEGTLHHRFLDYDLDGVVIAKTGTHDFASTLSGKLRRDGPDVLFVVSIFHHSMPFSNIGKTVHPVVDMIVNALDERF